ncbi:hypothetical protein Q1695_001506 [Nippostrongylus brasiliensis]|nr:hypothetical protein Q1695_001506 [Nippostrongylus brasiliensis]
MRLLLLMATIMALVVGAPRAKRQYYYSNLYGHPYTFSYFRGQPVYYMPQPTYYTQPSYGYYRRPYYRTSWENYPDEEPGSSVYYDNSYNNGGILGAAGNLLRNIIG